MSFREGSIATVVATQPGSSSNFFYSGATVREIRDAYVVIETSSGSIEVIAWSRVLQLTVTAY